MVNQRAFSFTDDSTDIASRALTLPDPLQSRSPFSLGFEPATNLVRLRRIQSPAYQKIFQSERRPIHALWPIICEAIRDMEQWYLSLQVNQALRHRAHCEILFSNILMLTPLNWIDELPEQGKFLVFRYAKEYADQIYSSIKDGSEFVGFYTSHDLLRASFVAQRFVNLLQSHYPLLISASVPSLSSAAPEVVAPPSVETGWTGPNLHESSGNISEQLLRIYDCLGHLEIAIRYFGSRYGYTDPLNEYKMDLNKLKQTLSNWAGNTGEEKFVP